MNLSPFFRNFCYLQALVDAAYPDQRVTQMFLNLLSAKKNGARVCELSMNCRTCIGTL